MWYSDRMDKYVYVELKEIFDKVGLRFHFVNRQHRVTIAIKMTITSPGHYTNKFITHTDIPFGEWKNYKARISEVEWYKYTCRLKDIL